VKTLTKYEGKYVGIPNPVADETVLEVKPEVHGHGKQKKKPNPHHENLAWWKEDYKYMFSLHKLNTEAMDSIGNAKTEPGTDEIHELARGEILSCDAALFLVQPPPYDA
jgi:hypothetical protein